MLLIVQKIIILSSSTVKLYTCQWPGVIPQLYSSFRVLTLWHECPIVLPVRINVAKLLLHKGSVMMVGTRYLLSLQKLRGQPARQFTDWFSLPSHLLVGFKNKQKVVVLVFHKY